MNIEWLFPKTVSRENQRTFRSVPHRKRKHTHKFLDGSCNAPFVKCGQHDLGIAVASKTVTQRQQNRAQALEIVDLAVKYHYKSAAPRGHRLASILRKIHHRESSV